MASSFKLSSVSSKIFNVHDIKLGQCEGQSEVKECTVIHQLSFDEALNSHEFGNLKCGCQWCPDGSNIVAFGVDCTNSSNTVLSFTKHQKLKSEETFSNSKPIFKLTSPSNSSVTFNPSIAVYGNKNCQKLYLACEGCFVVVYDTEKSSIYREYNVKVTTTTGNAPTRITCMSINAQDSLIVVGCSNGSIHFINTSTHVVSKMKETPLDSELKPILVNLTTDNDTSTTINSFNSKSNKSYLNASNLSSASSKSQSVSTSSNNSKITRVLFNNSSRGAGKKLLLVYSTDLGHVIIFDFFGKKVQKAFREHVSAPCSDLAFSTINNCLLVSVGLDKRCVFYDVESNQVAHSIKCQEPLTSVAVFPNGRTLAVGTLKGNIFIYDLSQFSSPIHVISNDTQTPSPITQLSFKPTLPSSKKTKSLSSSSSMSSLQEQQQNQQKVNCGPVTAKDIKSQANHTIHDMNVLHVTDDLKENFQPNFNSNNNRESLSSEIFSPVKGFSSRLSSDAFPKRLSSANRDVITPSKLHQTVSDSQKRQLILDDSVSSNTSIFSPLRSNNVSQQNHQTSMISPMLSDLSVTSNVMPQTPNINSSTPNLLTIPSPTSHNSSPSLSTMTGRRLNSYHHQDSPTLPSLPPVLEEPDDVEEQEENRELNVSKGLDDVLVTENDETKPEEKQSEYVNTLCENENVSYNMEFIKRCVQESIQYETEMIRSQIWQFHYNILRTMDVERGHLEELREENDVLKDEMKKLRMENDALKKYFIAPKL